MPKVAPAHCDMGFTYNYPGTNRHKTHIFTTFSETRILCEYLLSFSVNVIAIMT